jgi:hypothetical protein
MLVYHFKDRIFHLEKKLDTMFDIMNNVVKEMMVIKTQCAVSNYSAPLYQPYSNNGSTTESNIHNVYIPPITMTMTAGESLSPSLQIDKIIVSDDEDDDEDYDEEDFDDEDDDDDDDDDEDTEKISLKEELVESIKPDEDLVETVDVAELKPALVESVVSIETISEEPATIDSILSEIKEIDIPAESGIQIHATSEEHYHTKKYNKLDIPSLRAILEQKGCPIDTTKMKKKDLIELLNRF